LSKGPNEVVYGGQEQSPPLFCSCEA
jgi:hypothetical protein